MFPTNLSSEEKRSLIASLTEYLRTIAGNPAAAIFEAELLWLNDKHGEAEALLRSAAAGKDAAAAGLANVCLAGILAERDQEAEALQALRAAAEVKSSAFMAHWKAGQLQTQRGDMAAALQSFRNAAGAEVIDELLAPFASEYLALVAAVEGEDAVAAELARLIQTYPSNSALRKLAGDGEQ